GIEKVSNSIRLFMVPGMNHCAGGDGTSNFDRVAALEQWVEQKRAPDEMIGSHVTGITADRTRPLCPYPQVARYKGTGSVNDAANFVCNAPGCFGLLILAVTARQPREARAADAERRRYSS